MFQSISGIVLAAGASFRFPGNKLLYKVNGKPVIYHVIKALEPCCYNLALVIQPNDKKILQAVKDMKLDIVPNPDWKKGMTTSIRAGVRHLSDKVDAYAIMPADHPYLRPKDLKQFFIQVKTKSPLIALPTFQNRGGHPLVVSKKLFNELINLSEETKGLKALLKRYPSQIMRIPVYTNGIFHDIDEPNDLRGSDRPLK